MKNKKTIKNFSTDELLSELIDRGAEVADTDLYGGYKLIKKYSSDEREVSTKILILKNLSGV